VELNDKLDPFPWKNEEEHCSCMSNDAPFSPPVQYIGSLPSPPQPRASNALPPLITYLFPRIILSANKLFFIAHTIGNAASREWCLVHVAFCVSISLYPSSLQDGRFLVKFYVAHPNDMRFNATNQQLWLQYCNHTAPTFLAPWMPIRLHLQIHLRTVLCTSILS
jgi:hypothetical protein